MAQARGHALVPWTLRLFEGAPLPPAALGIAIAAAIFLVPIALAYREGFVLWGSAQLWIEGLYAVLIGYAASAPVYTMRGAERDLLALRPVLTCSDGEFARHLERVRSFGRTPLLVTGAVGLLLGLGVAMFRPAWVHETIPLRGAVWAWNVFRSVLLCWLVTRAVYLDVAGARRFSALGEDATRVDLLDLGPLAPYARRGLRSVVILVLFTVLFSGFALAPWGPGETIAVSFLILAGALGVLIVPVRGVHRCIEARKRAELERTRAEVRREREATFALREAGGVADAQLSNLIAYEARIESVNTWPFDVPTLLRFVIYVAIGLGSWVGAALVEQALGDALG